MLEPWRHYGSSFECHSSGEMEEVKTFVTYDSFNIQDLEFITLDFIIIFRWSPLPLANSILAGRAVLLEAWPMSQLTKTGVPMSLLISFLYVLLLGGFLDALCHSRGTFHWVVRFYFWLKRLFTFQVWLFILKCFQIAQVDHGKLLFLALFHFYTGKS